MALLVAAGLFVAVMIALSVLTSDVLPVLLALPLVAGAAFLAGRPGLLRLPEGTEPDAPSTEGRLRG